jgi:hypothetical protein
MENQPFLILLHYKIDGQLTLLLSIMCGQWKRQVLSASTPEIWTRVPLRTHLGIFVVTPVVTVGQFVDALKQVSSMALLCGTNCEDDGATLLDNLQSLLREPDNTSLPNPSTSCSNETRDVPESFHVAQHETPRSRVNIRIHCVWTV